MERKKRGHIFLEQRKEWFAEEGTWKRGGKGNVKSTYIVYHCYHESKPSSSKYLQSVVPVACKGSKRCPNVTELLLHNAEVGGEDR